MKSNKFNYEEFKERINKADVGKFSQFEEELSVFLDLTTL